MMLEGNEYPIELLNILQPGNKVRVYGHPRKSKNTLFHIRAVVDEEYVVYKVWSRRKQYWVYGVEHIYFFYLHWQKNFVELVK